MFYVIAPWWFISVDFFLDQHHNFWFGFVFRKLYPGLNENLEQFRKHLKESSQEMAALKVWQLQGANCELCVELLSLLFLCKVLSYMLCNFLSVNLFQYLFLRHYFYNCVFRGCVLLVLVLSSIFLILKLSKNKKRSPHVWIHCVQYPTQCYMSWPPNLNFTFRLVDVAVVTHLFGDSILIHRQAANLSMHDHHYQTVLFFLVKCNQEWMMN